MAGTRERDAGVDELRSRLRALGYLDAGVDRFVLAPARQARRPAAIAILASLRIGALAAVLLGPAAVIGLSERVPGLVTGPRDAVVLAVYIGALFGLAAAAAASATSLIALWLARRPGSVTTRGAGPLSIAAGLLVGLLCLVYLTLWWQTANAGFGWDAPVWTGFALSVAVAISLLLGHAVTLTALALIVGGDAREAPARIPRASWRVLATAGVIAFAGGAALLVLTASGDTQEDVPSLTVVPSGIRVRLVAVDGFDPGIFEELSASGRVPALGLMASGPHARFTTDLAAGPPDPARTWTTIATGQPPSVHGVRGLETRRIAGVQGSLSVPENSPLRKAVRRATDVLRLTSPAIASGTERRASTFWEVAARAGLRTAVINWWATWPAPADAGVILTDRATLRLETGGELDAEIAPASEYDRLRSQWPEIRRHASARAERAMVAAAAAERHLRELLKRSAELDALQLVLAAETAGPGTDLLAVYLPGLDIAQDALLGSEKRPGLAASTLAARLEALRDYYVVLDRLLGPEAAVATSELLLLVTSAGRIAEGAEGRLFARGTAGTPPVSLESSVMDIAPTVLHALGIPVSRELAGAPLTTLLPESFGERYPVRYVARYARPSLRPVDRRGQPLDQEMIERLRSLGYVK